MKYKVGDIVKLRDDLEATKEYGLLSFVKNMECIKNNPIKIIKKYEGEYYTDHNWYINDEMIEGLWEECKGITYEPYEEKTNKYKLIDILNKIANGELKEGTKVKYDGAEYIYQKEPCSAEEYDLYIENRLVTIFDNCYLSNVNDEVELIEPQEPKECEHEWAGYSLGRLGGRTEYRRRCKICGIDEEEPIDNTMEKIEELEWNRFNTADKIFKKIVFEKLNEVIRGFNKIQNIDK